MGVIFGGGNTSVFGSSGAGSLLAKMTAFVAVIFVITSLSYTYVTSEHVTDESAVLNVRIEEPAPVAAPAAPAQPEAVIPSAPVKEAPAEAAAPAGTKAESAPAAASAEAAPAEAPAAETPAEAPAQK